jgi:hypothetical protein
MVYYQTDQHENLSSNPIDQISTRVLDVFDNMGFGGVFPMKSRVG